MQAASATVSARAAPPVLTRARARASATLNAFAALVALAVTFIEHAQHLAFTVRAHVAEPADGLTRRFFETSGIRLIGMYMRRGAMRSVTLYRVLWPQTNRGALLRLRALLRDRTPPEQGGAHARAGTAAHDNAPAIPTHPKWHQTCDLSYLPGQEPVADAARRRAACSILSAISVHNRITAGSAGASRDELLAPIASFGGSLTPFIAEVDRCKAPASRVETPRFERAPEYPCPDSLSAEEQSCDVTPPQAASAECSSPPAEPCSACGETFARTEIAPAMLWPVSLPPMREIAATAFL